MSNDEDRDERESAEVSDSSGDTTRKSAEQSEKCGEMTDITRCFSVWRCSQCGHAYVTNSNSNPSSSAIFGMNCLNCGLAKFDRNQNFNGACRHTQSVITRPWGAQGNG